MTRKASSVLEMSYLQAIQSIPGITASAKLSWIGQLAYYKDEIERFGEFEKYKLSPKLQPLFEVETALRHQKHEDIASALRSNDWTIVNRALKADWFFDGDHMIVDVEYFNQCIFPYITLHTRIRLVKTFVRRIRNSSFAQRMFTALEYVYDYQTALPLIACCNEDFACNTVIDRKLMLPLAIFKKIFRRNLDLAVHLLKSFIFDCHEYAPIDKQIVKNDPCDVIERYKSFLSLLPKSRPMDFVDIVETIALCPNVKKMSNKCAKKFLSKAEAQVVRYPHLYMPILPTKIINSRQMEMIFPALMKHSFHNRDPFDTDLMLNYLKDYPKDRKLALLCTTFKTIYNDELLNTERVTPELLKLLPRDERLKQAKIKLDNSPFPLGTKICSDFFTNKIICYHVLLMYEKNWICYLPVEIAIPLIKCKMDHTKCDGEKVSYFIQMIYCSLVNKDNNELCKTLTCIIHSSAIITFTLSKLIIDHFLLIFNMRSVYLSESSISLMLQIIQSVYTKHKYINELVLEKMVHLSIIHKMPVENLLYIWINSHEHRVSNIQFNILKDYPLYERQCLVTFTDVCEKLYSNTANRELRIKVEEGKDNKYRMRRRTKKKSKEEQEEKYIVVCRLIVAMYDFNYRCKKSHVRAERMTVEDYPWLMNVIHVIMRSEHVCLFWKEAQDALRKQEEELYYKSIFPNTLTEIADVKSGAALRLLKENLESIRDNWEEYFIYCKRNYNNKQVQNFVRALRWYKDVPIKFANKCISHLRREITDEKSVLILLSILLHSDTVQKLITSCTTAKLNPNKKEYNRFMNHLSICMKFFNPPLPLKFFINNGTFNKSYRSTTLMVLRSVSRRSSLAEVMLFSNSFQNMDTEMRKQWIDLMYIIVPTNYFVTFLKKIWSVERHRSIRQLLLNTIQRLLCEKPRAETWNLCCEIFLGLSAKEEQLFWEMKYRNNIPDMYSEVYFNLWFNTINGFSTTGLSVERTRQHTKMCLSHLRRYIHVSLPEYYVSDIFQRFFFHSNVGLGKAVRSFAIKYLLKLSNDELTTCSKIIFRILFDTISISWNVSHPAHSLFYPIRCAVHSYFEQFIIAYMERRKDRYFDGVILDDMMLIFSTVLSPKQDIQSYLLLVYAKKLHAFSYVTPIVDNSFGLQLGQIIPDLINNLSYYMIDFIAVLLNYFLKKIYSPDKHHDVIFNTINGLMDATNAYANFVAITMLSLQERCRKYNQIIDKALNSFSYHSSYAIILHHYLNKASFNDVPLDDESDDIFADKN